MTAKAKRVVSRGLVSPTTYGTSLMRISLAVIITLSTVATVIYVVAIGTDHLYTIHNRANVYYTPATSSSSSSDSNDNGAAKVLLLPQFDATIGLVTACVGHSCFSRVSRTGVQTLIADTLGKQTFADKSAAARQAQLESEFLFGYDAGNNCSSNSQKLQRMAQFAYAALVVSLVFFLGTCVASMFFCLLVGDTDVLAGTPSLDRDSNAINVEDLGLPGIYVMYKLQRHLRHEGPLLSSVLALSGFAFIFSVCAMGVTIAVQSITTKCGTSVCASFKSSMEKFFAELAALHIDVSPTPSYACHTGASLSLSIVGFVLGLVCLLFACLMFAWFSCSQRRKDMLSLRDQLYRLADVQGLIGTIASNGETPFPLAQSRQVSGVASAGSVALSLAGAGGYGERDGGGNLIAYHRGASSISSGARRPSMAAFSAAEYNGAQARSVGARISLYRMLKQFMLSEDQARQNVMHQEKLEFFSLLALRESAWFDEEVCLLHRFALNYFVGPPLDLCVLETNARQLIADEYSNTLSASLKAVAGGFAEPPGEPPQAWARSGPLTPAESARWSQQVARWQQVQADFAPQLRQTASYARTDAAAARPPRRAASSLKLAPLTTGAANTLDSDHWLGILERLRGTAYEEGAFITRSASPLLLRRNTSALAYFEDDTSFSSNVFSDPSFALTRCEDFTVPIDNVRIHLVKSAYLTRTLPRPPPRLHTLPQHDDAKRPASAKSGSTGRRRRSSTSSSSRPNGRSPSPQARSPAMTTFAAGDDTNSLASGVGGKGDALHGAVRPFSSRDGTSSGRTPFQTAFAAHNASLAGSPNTSSLHRLGLNGGNNGGDGVLSGAPERSSLPSVNASQGAAFPTGSSWRFQNTA